MEALNQITILINSLLRKAKEQNLETIYSTTKKISELFSAVTEDVERVMQLFHNLTVERNLLIQKNQNSEEKIQASASIKLNLESLHLQISKKNITCSRDYLKEFSTGYFMMLAVKDEIKDLAAKIQKYNFEREILLSTPRKNRTNEPRRLGPVEVLLYENRKLKSEIESLIEKSTQNLKMRLLTDTKLQDQSVLVKENSALRRKLKELNKVIFQLGGEIDLIRTELELKKKADEQGKGKKGFKLDLSK